MRKLMRKVHVRTVLGNAVMGGSFSCANKRIITGSTLYPHSFGGLTYGRVRAFLPCSWFQVPDDHA